MVHALEKTHSMLKPGGLLVDIHPTGEPPVFEVHIGDQVTPVGLMQETDDFIEYFQADSALQEATRRGLFSLERDRKFTFLTHAETAAQLHDFLAAEWKDAILDEGLFRRADELLGAPGAGKEIVLRENVHIARLRSVV